MKQFRLALIIAGGLVAVAIVAMPLVGWPRVVRLPALLVPALTLAILLTRPWRDHFGGVAAWDAWRPSSRVVWVTFGTLTLLFWWIVLTRFRNGEINAVDFTVYFDRPMFQTLQGRPLFVEVANQPEFSQRSQLAVHGHWILLPLASLYAIRASPLWLLGLSVIAVVAGAVHLLRIMQRLGAGGVLSMATALAYVLNRNTAQTLNYGFHPEVLYAWFIPAMIDAGLRRRWVWFLVAAVAAMLVKEDAVMPIFAASAALALNWSTPLRWTEAALLAAPPVAALVSLELYYAYAVPIFSGATTPTYASFWASYGPTPDQALVGMMFHPWSVVRRALTSGFFSNTLVTFLWLPLIGWRWSIGILPIVLLYGASDYALLREFNLYYAVVVVPFLVIGAAAGAGQVATLLTVDARKARLGAALLVLGCAVLVGSTNGGYALRPWKREIAAVPRVIDELRSEPVVLVQGGLYPHTGYDGRVKLLTPATLVDRANAGAAVVLAERISPYPLSWADWKAIAQLPEVRRTPAGILVVRLPPP